MFTRLQTCFVLMVILLAVFLFVVGCEDGTGPPPPPPPPPPPSCAVNHTGTLVVENRSSRTTYEVLLNNVSYGSMGPGGSKTMIVDAGEDHTLIIRFANSTTYACQPAGINVPQCYTQTVWCTIDL